MTPERLMPPQHEQVLRLVHALGVVTLPGLLSEFRVRAISARMMRYTVDGLTARGWLDRVAARPEPARGRGTPARTAWTVSEAALAYLHSDARLPREPAPLRRTAARPAKPNLPTSTPALRHTAPQPSLHGAAYDKYLPPPWQSVRPGADDHRRWASRGVRC